METGDVTSERQDVAFVGVDECCGASAVGVVMDSFLGGSGGLAGVESVVAVAAVAAALELV